MPCNVIIHTNTKDVRCNKPTGYYGTIYDEHHNVIRETETCEDCYNRIRREKKK